jgi:suppressor of ftsI
LGFVRIILVILLFCAAVSPPVFGQESVLTNLPEVRGSFTLTAVHDPVTARNAFEFDGKTVPPVIRVSPGSVISRRYANKLPHRSDEACATGPCANMSNLHFHGLHVSPEVPSYSPPGLYWYHTHPHGESARQDLDGMSGAIIVDGIDRYYPELRHMRERVLILRDGDLEHAPETRRKQISQGVEVSSSPCGTSTEQSPERVFTLNGAIRPQIPIAPGERQFWRIVNASPDRYADLQVGGQQLEIVALDGMPSPTITGFAVRARSTTFSLRPQEESRPSARHPVPTRRSSRAA